MTNDMTKGSPIKLILSFMVPLLIGNIFQQFYNMADTIIVGRTISVEALAAVGATGSISFLIVGFVQGVTSGFAVITAQRFGAGSENGVRRSVATSIILGIAVTIVMTAISVLAGGTGPSIGRQGRSSWLHDGRLAISLLARPSSRRGTGCRPSLSSTR